MRLVDGSTIDDGRVEVCINQAWGSICSSGWNIQDVFVVCKQLGYVIKIMESMHLSNWQLYWRRSKVHQFRSWSYSHVSLIL